MLLTLSSLEPHINSHATFSPFYQQQNCKQNTWCQVSVLSQDLQRFNLSCFTAASSAPAPSPDHDLDQTVQHT